MRTLLRNNGLSLAMFALFLITFAGGQVISGWKAHNEERSNDGESALSLGAYLASAHFVEATSENWESEFFQMFIYVGITAFLFQKGSAESNDPDKSPSERKITADSPWPVKRGGLWKRLYAHSLSGAFALLFLISFCLHAVSSQRMENEERARKHRPAVTLAEHLRGSTFWFESFQNWQSEFLAIGSMVVLSVFLRERGSPESKDLAAPHSETG